MNSKDIGFVALSSLCGSLGKHHLTGRPQASGETPLLHCGERSAVALRQLAACCANGQQLGVSQKHGDESPASETQLRFNVSEFNVVCRTHSSAKLQKPFRSCILQSLSFHKYPATKSFTIGMCFHVKGPRKKPGFGCCMFLYRRTTRCLRIDSVSTLLGSTSRCKCQGHNSCRARHCRSAKSCFPCLRMRVLRRKRTFCTPQMASDGLRWPAFWFVCPCDSCHMPLWLW